MQPKRNRHTLALLAVFGLVAASGVFAQADVAGPPAGGPGPAACAVPPCGPLATPQHPHPGAGPHHPHTGARMRHLDADRDGQVSREELLAAHRRQLERFDQADRNRDGLLSADELRAWRSGSGAARPPCASADRSS